MVPRNGPARPADRRQQQSGLAARPPERTPPRSHAKPPHLLACQDHLDRLWPPSRPDLSESHESQLQIRVAPHRGCLLPPGFLTAARVPWEFSLLQVRRLSAHVAWRSHNSPVAEMPPPDRTALDTTSYSHAQLFPASRWLPGRACCAVVFRQALTARAHAPDTTR